jgi:hypothetical protein
MNSCVLCGKRKLFGGFEEEGRFYCSKKCREGYAIAEKGFCPKCIDLTTEETIGGARSFNGIGTGLGFTFRGSKCPDCNSMIKRKWFYFGFPIVPMGKFRIIKVLDRRGFGEQTRIYLSRKLKVQ